MSSQGGKATGTQIKSLKRLGTLSEGSVVTGFNTRVGIWNHLRDAGSQRNKILHRVWGKNGWKQGKQGPEVPAQELWEE